MSDRTPSEKIWSDLESQLSAMDHTQLVRICAHLIRTYVVEDRGSLPSASAQQAAPRHEERPAPARPASNSPFGGDTPKQDTEEPPREKPKKQEPGYNKLEMD